MLHLGTVLAEVTPQLQAATDVGAGHNLSSGAAEVVGLELAEFCGLVRLHQVVDAGTPATHAGFRGFFELKLGNGTQQLPGLGCDPLAMNHVAGVVIRHLAGQRCECLLKRLGKPPMRQKFMHVQHRRTEVGCAIEKLPIGLHGVPATGGGHQHGIQGFIAKALHQRACQLLGLLELALVMTRRPAATLFGWNHHLKAIGLQDGHGGLVHPRIKATLDATQHQTHPPASLALRWTHERETIGKPLGR